MGYATATDICNFDPKFKKNCCRTCGVPSDATNALRDSIIMATGTTTATTTTATTAKQSTTTTTTTTIYTSPTSPTPSSTTPKPTAAATTATNWLVATQTPAPTTTPKTAVSSCQDDPAAPELCKSSMYVSKCNENILVTKNGSLVGFPLGPIAVVCKATCGKC